jgi:hypothetical protein
LLVVVILLHRFASLQVGLSVLLLIGAWLFVRTSRTFAMYAQASTRRT